MKFFRNALIALALLWPTISMSFAQSYLAATTPSPILITAGNTFQVALATTGTTIKRRSLTIQNNNAADGCYLLVGGPWVAGDTTASTRTVNGVSIAAIKGAIFLQAGQSYTRYFPYVPNDQILATCATTADSLYIDTQ